jgi:acyl dehydratase
MEELKGSVGGRLGVSDWHRVTQDQVNQFAEATGDHQWIHVDQEKAAAGPFKRTIAHGYLTMSLAPMLLHEVMDVEGVGMGINYGLNRVRFPSPMPVGEQVRMAVDVQSVEEFDGGAQCVFVFTFEREGEEKPVCVSEAVFRFYT